MKISERLAMEYAGERYHEYSFLNQSTMLSFKAGYKAAVEMLRSEEALEFQNGVFKTDGDNPSMIHWADFLEREETEEER